MINTVRVMAAFFTLAGLVLSVPPAGAQEGIIRELAGEVEIKAPGSGEWVRAARGDRVGGKTLISTGFRSSAVIALGNSSLIIRPLTRLSLEEISRRDGEETVSLGLRAGRVRAEVAPPREGRTEFVIRSPTATASVRGTVFDFDTVNLSVEEGTVLFSGSDGRPMAVAAGERSLADEKAGRASAPREAAIAELVPDLPAGSESGTAAIPEEVVSIAAPAEPLDVGVDW
jgi:hypothetical protein